MRVLSLIPTLLFAAASFVAAAPAPVPSDPTPAVPACSTGDTSGVQPIIDIVVKATADITPLVVSLTAAVGASPCDGNEVAGIVTNIQGIVVDVTAQLTGAVNTVNWASINVTAVIAVLSPLVCQISAALIALTACVNLNLDASVIAVICGLLKATLGFTGCLNGFASAALTVVLGPVVTACGSAVLLVAAALKISL